MSIEVTVDTYSIDVHVDEPSIAVSVDEYAIEVVTSGPPGPSGSGGGGSGGVYVQATPPSSTGLDIVWVDIDDTSSGGGDGGAGVSDHGLLTGLTDDDHTQYYNQARGDARYSQTTHNHTGVYDPAGTASSAVTAHVALADPHTQYLRTSEVVAGANITVDTATTPGSAIIAATSAIEGPAGPVGPPGDTYLDAQWNFNQNTVVSPASGTLRLNATTLTAATFMWISETDRDGLDRTAGLSLIVVGDKLMLQSAQGRAVYTVSSHADSGTYRTIGLTLVETTGTRPSASSVTTIYMISAQGGTDIPAGGTDGQVLTKTSSVNYEVAWETPTVGGGVTIHNDLTGRSTSDAHPVSAVTGLQTALDGKAATGHTHTGTYWGLWTGTQIAYDAIGTKDSNTLYVVTA